jgi:hypothetical protein
MRFRSISLIVLAVLLWPLTGCEEVNSPAVTDIGVTRLLFVDPGIRSQSVSEPDSTIQWTKWVVMSAMMDYDGNLVDLRFGSSCTFDATSFAVPSATGACEAGVVVPASEDPVVVQIDLQLTMQVHRARPLDLPDAEDFDGDTVANAADNCPLIPNPDQRDSDGEGTGDACSIFLSGFFFPDNDGDGVRDIQDNCVWIANPAQLDTSGLTSKGLPDGIGDACEDQAADVQDSGGSNLIELQLTIDDFVQPLGGSTFLVIDFDSLETFTACNWEGGTCTLDESAVVICDGASIGGSTIGCPDETKKK